MTLARYQTLIAQIDSAVRAMNFAAAGRLAEEALGLGPEHPVLLNLAAYRRMERGEPETALPLLERAHTMAPGDVHILNTLGLARRRTGDLPGARKALETAVTALPTFTAARLNLAAVLEDMGDLESAESHYGKVLETEPGNAQALTRASYLSAAKGDYEQALAIAERMPLAASEGSHAGRLSYFARMRGDIAAALVLARKAVAAESGAPRAMLTLAQAEFESGASANALERAGAVSTRTDADAEQRAAAFALVGDIEHRNKHPKEAFEAYRRAKELQRAKHAAEFEAPGRERYIDMVERLNRHLAQSSMTAQGSPSASQPVRTHAFLVGFPRSGTTLLEQALAGSSEIETLMEQDALAQASRDFIVPHDGLVRLGTAASEHLDAYCKSYWQTVRGHVPSLKDKIFVDKMPLHSVSLCLVARLFPSARILVALRDPRDVVLSCFRRMFEMTEPMYEFCTLEGTARLYDAVMRLILLYEQKLPLAFLRTRYEDLVADFEGETKRVCAFLGATWEPAMRDVDERARERAIRTPSAPQLARGLYDGSGQWRRYAAELKPVLPILAPWIRRFGYSED